MRGAGEPRIRDEGIRAGEPRAGEPNRAIGLQPIDPKYEKYPTDAHPSRAARTIDLNHGDHLRSTPHRTERLQTVTSATRTEQDDKGTNARNELDTRADTSCAGVNWRPLSYTGQCCDVSGFHDDFSKLPNIPIATVASTHRSIDGTKSILIMNEVLYFGGKLDHSLINPNQIRHYGIAVSDNPFDADKPLGIDHDQDFIPFEVEGATVYFETTYPTLEEIKMHPHLVLTDGELPWDPMGVDM
ncbi:hypothetical protein ACHAWF_006766, partial [Thalassiosira exigua]